MKVFTTNELRAIMKHARKKGIGAVSEINVPGHTASWGGIPGLLVWCPTFVCKKGDGAAEGVKSNTVTRSERRPERSDRHF